MTTSRITWSTALRGPEDYVPVVLIAGVPRVLVPAGLAPTSTSVTSGTVDAAWWPGTGTLTQTLHDGPVDVETFNPVRGWLDPSTEWRFYEEARALEGDVRVEALTFDVWDPSSAATAELSGASARVSQLLRTTIDSAATTIPVQTLSGVPSYGIGYIGREAFTYSSRTSSPPSVDIIATGTTRGAYGSRAIGHTAPAEHLPLVTFALPRYWQGRRVAVFVCRVDGSALRDPTLIFLGTVGAGVRMAEGGTRWQIPADSITVALNRKIGTQTLLLSGFAHDIGFYGSNPLTINGRALTAENNGGYHDRLSDFIADLNAFILAAGGTDRADVAGGYIVVSMGAAAGETRAPWNMPMAQVLDASSTTTLQNPAPRACLPLDGVVHLSSEDYAKIPTTLTATATVGAASGAARFALVADTDRTKGLVAEITSADGTAKTITVNAIIDTPATFDGYLSRSMAALCTKPTTARLTVTSTGDTTLSALRALIAACDVLGGGGDMMDDGIDWTSIAAEFQRVPLAGGLDLRHYRPSENDTPLVLLLQEFRLRGCVMTMRNGRIACARLATFASTERVARSITEGDILKGSDGKPIPAEVEDSYQPTASSMSFVLPGGETFTWVDTTFRDEFGDGARVECRALAHLLETASTNGIVTTLQQIAQQLLGPLAEPQRIVRITLGPRFLDVMPGDLVTFTHSWVPGWDGVRGVSSLVCQVVDVRRTLWGGTAAVQVGLRLGRTDVSGYAPSALVSGISGAVLTLDTTSAFGASCFADTRTDPSDGFAIGDKVVLSELDTESPRADASFTVTDVTATTITLDSAPDAGTWGADASTPYKVLVRFAAYSTATTAQHRFAFIADPTTLDVGSGGTPYRWAA